MSATMPLDVMAQVSVSLVVLEYLLEMIENPSEIRVSAAIVTKSFPAIAIKIIENLVNIRKDDSKMITYQLSFQNCWCMR